MDKYINILVIDDNFKTQNGLKEILSENGTNILISKSYEEALTIVSRKKIGIIILNIDTETPKNITYIKEVSLIENTYLISLTNNEYKGIKSVKGLNKGAVDYITLPLTPNLIKAKVDVFKSLHFKDLKINQLLKNIFPENVLSDLNEQGKFLPRRIENGVVLFTDFVHFSQKSKEIRPMELLKKLEHYFNFFEKVVHRFKLEKIKTIGDSYMVIGGVNDSIKQPAIRACLAAIEIKNFVIQEKLKAKAAQKDYWDIRIGIHSGPLVAGIIGTKKLSFDVWGDTVNIASRAEQASEENEITVTKSIVNQIGDFFDIQERGGIEIKKRGGTIKMFFLKKIKLEYSLFSKGITPNTDLRILCDLSNVNFESMRTDILNLLKNQLQKKLTYHDVEHTLEVEKTALYLAEIEGLNEEDIIILQTAILYHDYGFTVENEDNEKHAIKFALDNLPKYGYTQKQVQIIVDIISVTKKDAATPRNVLEKIMLDADHDYLGREDYFFIVKKLRLELENYGGKMTEKDWVLFQINYLENKHRFYTETAKNFRVQTKKENIKKLKQKLKNESIY